MAKRAFFGTLCKSLHVHQSGSLGSVRLPLSCILSVEVKVEISGTGRPIIRTCWTATRKIQKRFGKKTWLTSVDLVTRFVGGSFSVDAFSYSSFLFTLHFWNPSCNYLFVSCLFSIFPTLQKQPDAPRTLCTLLSSVASFSLREAAMFLLAL